MHVLTGTSGFSYDEWHGRFYPHALSADDRLSHYCTRLHSVEINNTFYQMPKVALLERWRDAVSDDFRFALKAPRRITHSRQLKEVGESLHYFLTALAALGTKLGPVLFQLPPFSRKDTQLLAEFLAALPVTLRVAFEFRHPSWFDDNVFTLLADSNVALCCGDAERDNRSPPLVATANFGYLRLRAASYDEPGLRTWSERILAQPWTDAYAYLKHEVLGPDYAEFLAEVATGAQARAFPTEAVSPVVPKTQPARPRKGLARTKPSTVEADAAKARSAASTRRAR